MLYVLTLFHYNNYGAATFALLGLKFGKPFPPKTLSYNDFYWQNKFYVFVKIPTRKDLTSLSKLPMIISLCIQSLEQRFALLSFLSSLYVSCIFM